MSIADCENRPTYFDRLAGGILHRVGAQIAQGRLTFVGPDGVRRCVAGSEPGPDATMILRNWRLLRRLVLGGSIGFAEAYVDGEWDTPDLAELLTLLALNERALRSRFAGSTPGRLAARAVHLVRPNSRNGAAKNIARHYDLGNGFYERWLDPTMTYSAAIFETDRDDLERAQIAKYRRLAAAARIGAGQRVLEIGCGWGGFARWAARELNCHVTGITISPSQYAYGREAVQREGLDGRVDLRLQDYRDITGHFDRIVSIEMFEAVGERYWPIFFDVLDRRLASGGIAALQVITIADDLFDRYRRGADFIQRHIFPGGMLPGDSALRARERAAGFARLSDAGYGPHYARTLAAWRTRFTAAWPDIERLGYDERFRRLWHYYLAYCEAGFRTGRVDVRQIALARA